MIYISLGLALKGPLDPSQIEPPILLIAVLSCSIFCLLLSFVLFFLFLWAPFKPASLNWASLNKYCSK